MNGLMQETRRIGTLTGSSIISGVEPRDMDFFALYKEPTVKWFLEHGARWADNASMDSPDWGKHRCVIFTGPDNINVELFFVEKKYYRVLQRYTRILHASNRDPVLHALLSSKPIRVSLAEALRREELERLALKGKA